VDASTDENMIRHLRDDPWFQHNHNWLLLVDNLDVKDCLPTVIPQCDHGSIILTSDSHRINDEIWSTAPPRSCRVWGLEKEDALKLLKATVSPSDDEPLVELRALAETLLEVRKYTRPH
jgi:hypothetical protein